MHQQAMYHKSFNLGTVKNDYDPCLRLVWSQKKTLKGAMFREAL